ncbi:PIN-like domain-containing protein [Streptomyces anulatus]|uniref:PIN-like domain-containing protein n=1 Tax=Streptomyces anulatus TaxID=1892 RepID=UPI0036897A38
MSNYHRGSFTDGYEGYWRKSAADVEHAIKSSTIVLDTNALLSIYRMESTARGEYLTVLGALAPRLWIPRQVVEEFHRNRISSLDSHVNALREKSKAVGEAVNELQKRLKDLAKLRSLAGRQIQEYMKPFDESLAGIEARIESDLSEFDLNAGGLAAHDPILDSLSRMLDGRVGGEFGKDEIEAARGEARRRGESEQPPGYRDYKRKGDEGLGDCILWLQMLDHAAEEKRAVLFISTDTKDDWIRYQCGLVIGPRPELIKEMREKAGVEYHHITLSELLSRAGQALEVAVSQNTIDQAAEDPKRRIRVRELRGQRAALGRELARIRAEISNAKNVVDMERLEMGHYAKEVELLGSRIAGNQEEGNKEELLMALREAEVRYSAHLSRSVFLSRDLQGMTEREGDVIRRMREVEALLAD